MYICSVVSFILHLHFIHESNHIIFANDGIFKQFKKFETRFSI